MATKRFIVRYTDQNGKKQVGSLLLDELHYTTVDDGIGDECLVTHFMKGGLNITWYVDSREEAEFIQKMALEAILQNSDISEEEVVDFSKVGKSGLEGVDNWDEMSPEEKEDIEKKFE